MDTIPSFVVFIGGLVLAALIVAVGFYVYNNQKAAADTVNAQVTDMSNQLQEQQWTQYEGAETSGSEVLTVIKKMKDSGTFVAVNGTYYGCDESLELQTQEDWDAAIKLARKRGDANYIVPSKTYYGTVVRDEDTTAILGIEFTSEAP